MNFPSTLKYTKTHEWAKLDGKTVTVGLSDYAQKEISDVVYVDLPKIGQKIEQGKTACVVESVKAAFDIYAPVSGTVTTINEALTKDPALVNQDPYGKGWLFQVEPGRLDEMKSLMDAATYEVQLKAGTH